MKFTIENMMENSFVIVKDDFEYGRFCSRMRSAGFSDLPRKYFGLFPRGLMQCSTERVPMVACALSHFSIVNMAFAMNCPSVTIFESDAYPMNQCHEKLDALFSENGIPDDAHLITLGNLHFIREYDNGKNNHSLCDVKDGFGRINGNLWGAHAVILLRDGYEAWLGEFRKHDTEFHADYFNQLCSRSYSTDRSYFIQVKKSLEYPDWIRDKQYLSDFPEI